MPRPNFGLKPLPTVIDPTGRTVTRDELPTFEQMGRWTVLKKKMVVDAVNKGLLTTDEALTRYRLSQGELEMWKKRLEMHGVKGLRHLKFGLYPLTDIQTAASLPTTGKAVFGALTIDLVEKQVFVAGHEVELTYNEYNTLELLAMYPGQVVSKELFMLHLHGEDIELPNVRLFDVLVCRLRKIIAALSDKNYIETVWGRGAVLSAPEEIPVTA